MRSILGEPRLAHLGRQHKQANFLFARLLDKTSIIAYSIIMGKGAPI